jgi:hypothetical protein
MELVQAPGDRTGRVRSPPFFNVMGISLLQAADCNKQEIANPKSKRSY